MNKVVQRVGGLVVLVAAVVVAVQGVDFHTVWRNWQSAHRWLLLVVIGLTSADLVVRAVAWKVTINPLKRTPLRHVLPSYLIGMASNVVLPLKLGDVAGSYYLGQSERLSNAALISTAVIQRVFEGITLLFVVAFVVMMSSVPPAVSRGVALFVLLTVVATAGMYLVVATRHRIIGLSTCILRRFCHGTARQAPVMVRAFFRGAAAIRDARVVIAMVVLHLGSWLVQILTIYLLARALSIELDLTASAVVLVVVNVGILIPLAPGNVGMYQLLCILALSLFSVGKSHALGFGVLYQVLQGVPVIVGGALSLLLRAAWSGPDSDRRRRARR